MVSCVGPRTIAESSNHPNSLVAQSEMNSVPSLVTASATGEIPMVLELQSMVFDGRVESVGNPRMA